MLVRACVCVCMRVFDNDSIHGSGASVIIWEAAFSFRLDEIPRGATHMELTCTWRCHKHQTKVSLTMTTTRYPTNQRVYDDGLPPTPTPPPPPTHTHTHTHICAPMFSYTQIHANTQNQHVLTMKHDIKCFVGFASECSLGEPDWTRECSLGEPDWTTECSLGE